MGRFRAFNGRHGLEMAVVLVPLLAILVLQYVSSRRLAEVEVIAHQTTVARYLEAVAADVRSVYENAAHEMLDVSGDVLAAKRFDEVARHFDRTDTSAARLLFAAALDGCLCLTRYYDPMTGEMRVGAEPDIEAVVLRASSLLYMQEVLPLDRSRLYVDEADPDNRVVYRFVTGGEAERISIIGFVVDTDRLERDYLPRALDGATNLLAEDVRANLIVRVADETGRVVIATNEGAGQTDLLEGHFDFLFGDWNLSARSRHTAAAQVLESNASTSWMLTVLMSVAVLGGVLRTWRAANREQRLARIRNAFVANVSHELRTPLASISMFGEFLRRGRVESQDKVVEYGGRIERESDRLGHLIDNVLDFARIESVETRYRCEDAMIEDVVGPALRAVDARRERDGFAISVTRPDEPLPAVSVDVQAMSQVFVNLLDNAMKYSGQARRIRVDLSQRDGNVAVSVTDSGIGIAPGDQEKIFHQFYRGNAAVAGRVTGTGLGLAIARHVVRAHRGRIEVDSGLGRGTTFTVRIPAAVVATARAATGVSASVQGVGLGVGAKA